MDTSPKASSGPDCYSISTTDVISGEISLVSELTTKGKAKNSRDHFSSQIQAPKSKAIKIEEIDRKEIKATREKNDVPSDTSNRFTKVIKTESFCIKKENMLENKKLSEMVLQEVELAEEEGSESEEPEYIQLDEDVEDEFLFKSEEILQENDSPIQFWNKDFSKQTSNPIELEAIPCSLIYYLLSRVFDSVKVKRKQILQDLPDTYLAIYVHEDSTDSFQLTELFDLVGQNARYISYQKLVSKNLDFEWHELHQLKTNVIMSKTCFFSALYHGLLEISQISSIFVENLEVFEALVNIFKDILLPIKFLPPVFGIRLQDLSTFSQIFKASFHFHTGLQNYSIPAALLKENLQGLSDLKKLKAEHEAIFSSLGNWGANLFLSHEFKKMHEKMDFRREGMPLEDFSQINDFLNDVQARLQAELDVSLFQLANEPQFSPIHHLWKLLISKLMLGIDLKFIILVHHQAIKIYLVELLCKLTTFFTGCNVHSGYKPHSDKGLCISVCTREAFVANENSCIVYSLDCLHSLAQYFCLRSQLESLSCELVVYSCSSNPINSYLQEFENMASIATFFQLYPQYTRANFYQVHSAESGAILTLTSAALFLTEACETPSLSGKDSMANYNHTILQGSMFVCNITLITPLPLKSFNGTPQKTMVLARQVARWELCIHLQRVGILDSRFLPLANYFSF